MKIQVTQKQVKNSYTVVAVGHCELQTLLEYKTPRFFTAGIYGWSSDIYIFKNIAISTGYASFSNLKKDFHELARIYEKRAIELKSLFSREVLRVHLDGLIDEFLSEVKFDMRKV